MSSTKLIRVLTDPLKTRLTTAEVTLANLDLDAVKSNDNISELVNDVQYQTLTQVDTKINALIDSAPGTLDTLGEIATALAAEDSAIAALTAVNTTQNTAIAALQSENAAQATAITAVEDINDTQDTAIATLQTDSHDAAISGNAAISINPNQEVSLKISNEIDNLAILKNDGLFVKGVATITAPSPQVTNGYPAEYRDINHLIFT
ncbi:MAG: hypothetical protein HC939_13335 [Pleurocapsa sp. SU_5_0]|nr:hypothetical protein [Pleurocapsa sp. SU_5_0]NJO98984.1 hypothetical protein [Pleurocapsa sp. CRU_1_2]NJR46337.1 hypothetical protein [Hyellaceae cyanobacterium CSU_1_1]